MQKSNKLTDVQIIEPGRDLVLVQWLDGQNIPQRTWVKKSAVVDQQGRSAKVENPSYGYPYGVEFRRFVKTQAIADDLERELKTRGIWTVEDVRSRPQEVMGAIIAVSGVELSALLVALGNYERELKKTEA